MKNRVVAMLVALTAALVVASAASAHAIVSPAVAVDKKLQQFTLSVPTEKEGAVTTAIELSVPSGFSIDSFEAAPGWKRSAHGSTVSWTGGHVPTEEDAVFRFNASASAAKTYTFTVRQTYSDGSVVEWNGPESSDNPAPTMEAVSSLGGGGGNSTLSIIAIAVAGVSLLVALAALVARGGRSLT